MYTMWMCQDVKRSISDYLYPSFSEYSSLSPVNLTLAYLARALEYAECFSAEVEASLNKCLGYFRKPSDGEAPILGL